MGLHVGPPNLSIAVLLRPADRQEFWGSAIGDILKALCPASLNLVAMFWRIPETHRVKLWGAMSKVPKSVHEEWQATLDAYIKGWKEDLRNHLNDLGGAPVKQKPEKTQRDGKP